MTSDDRAPRAPRDIVPPQPLTREDVLRLRAAAGQPITVVEPGAPVYGPDGDLIGMTAPTTSSATLAYLRISDDDAARLGLPAGDDHGHDDDDYDGDHDGDHHE